MKRTWIETNQTLECLLETKSNEDFFEDIYSDPWINRLMIAIHFITYIPLLGLVSVAWFERTGQAGPYRTLINRLVSFQIDSMAFYFMTNSLDCLRAAYGPLHPFLCDVNVFFKNYIHLNVVFYMAAITIAKFSFVCVYKSIPTIEDNFLATSLQLCINLMSTGCMVVMLMLPGKVPLNYLICTGTFYEEWVDEEKRIAIPNYITLICVITGLIFSIPTIVFSKKSLKKVNPSNGLANIKNQNSTNFGSVPRSWMIFFWVCVGMVALVKTQSHHPKELSKYPNNLWLYTYQFLWPFAFAWSVAISYFAKNHHFRGAIFRLFKPQIQQPQESDSCRIY